ncbi:MAG: chemotaxis protein CheW [Candidatus Wallbacteria bacterium HGW-Wallbacteria-1]|jgi:purine-binding chemotaxis protein CheW|uniref:Chemotaxis protein CheW n=1 Tax=Candidatus Wallbacteria bacterium HGW-Wallbacteria-1 TaxID=2013854 RepID=A0A2N1PKP1_9BACT|nr:MAG: chemotaxis protein CheW [Candidatus Wallbacteria bacterium HGW-Wallbacteria-1]
MTLKKSSKTARDGAEPSTPPGAVWEDGLRCVVFTVGELTCAVEIEAIQEINRGVSITPVHRAPESIKGVINLRGDIVTVIDMMARMEQEPIEVGPETPLLIVNMKGEHYGLIADTVDDILFAPGHSLEAPPPNMRGVAGKYFSRIFKMDGKLAGILDLDKILDI